MMARERLGTGLAAGALSVLVLVTVLLAGVFGLGPLGDTVGPFSPAPGWFGDRLVMLDPPPGPEPAPDGVTGPAEPAEAVEGPTGEPAGPPPAPGAPPGPAVPLPGPTVPSPPPPGPDPAATPQPATPSPPPVPLPDGPPPGTAEGTVGSVVALTTATVDGTASTVGDTLDTTVGLLSAPARDVQATADEPDADPRPAAATVPAKAAGGSPASPRPPTLPDQAAPAPRADPPAPRADPPAPRADPPAPRAGPPAPRAGAGAAR